MVEAPCQTFQRLPAHKGQAQFDLLCSCSPCQNSNVESDFEVLKGCVLEQDGYSLKSIVIEQEKSKLKTEVGSNGKQPLY